MNSFGSKGSVLRNTKSDNLPLTATVAPTVKVTKSGPEKKIAVFYHVFFPGFSSGEANALRIIKEQLGTLANSSAALAAQSQDKPLSIFYTVVGSHKRLNEYEKQIQELCSAHTSLLCQRILHVESGFETVTLQKIYDHCNGPDETTLITYLHNKGSYHTYVENERWRPLLTEAAVSDMCISNSLSGECNLCSLHFFPTWSLFAPGNMFTARCDYFKKLIPPNTIEKRQREDAISEAVLLRLQGQLEMNVFYDRNDIYGLGRFSDEHWVAGHPDLKPCDCIETDLIEVFRGSEVANLSFALAPARHRGMRDPGIATGKEGQVLVESDLRKKEMFFLPLNIIKWLAFYGRIPSHTSRVWKWFPDHSFWRQQVNLYGAGAVEQATAKYASDLVQKGPTFAPRDKSTGRWWWMTSGMANSLATATSSYAVFYDVFIPPYTQNFDDEWMFVQEQINIMDRSLSFRQEKTDVYISTAGHRKLDRSKLCERGDNLLCHRLDHHHSQHYRGETLQQAHEYCSHHPSSKISYIRNVPPHQVEPDSLEARRLLRHLTAAATNELCFEASTCNVCGLLFYTMPTHAMMGNTWTAQCSYVNKLLSPVDFEQKLRPVIAEALMQKLEDKLAFQIFEPRVDQLGLDGHAMEHWIGSHPSLIPCDLSPKRDLPAWIEGSTNYTWSLGPRHEGAPFGFNEVAAKKATSVLAVRFREFHYLAGNLLKWKMLYAETPPLSSWVWSWYPDGEIWRKQIDEGASGTSFSSYLPLEKDVSENLAIFYNIYIPPAADEKEIAVDRVKRVVKEQLDQIGASDVVKEGAVSLFYNTIGAPDALGFDFMDPLCSKNKLKCHHMDHFKIGFEEVTLQRVHDFCQDPSRADFRIIYLHSKGSFHEEIVGAAHEGFSQIAWRRNMLNAVTNKKCLRPPDDQCDICGLLASPFPQLHFSGNFFTAKCSYVKKLLPVKDFGTRMDTIIASVREREIDQQLVVHLFHPHDNFFGTSRFASEHWIGSHPSVRPCDVSMRPSIDDWRRQEWNTSEFDWAMAPRFGVDAPWAHWFEETRRKTVLSSPSMRHREYFLLAGSLFRWYELYDQAPPPSSWVWSWYPDGREWKEKVLEHKRDALAVMTKPFQTNAKLPLVAESPRDGDFKGYYEVNGKRQQNRFTLNFVKEPNLGWTIGGHGHDGDGTFYVSHGQMDRLGSAEWEVFDKTNNRGVWVEGIFKGGKFTQGTIRLAKDDSRIPFKLLPVETAAGMAWAPKDGDYKGFYQKGRRKMRNVFTLNFVKDPNGWLVQGYGHDTTGIFYVSQGHIDWQGNARWRVYDKTNDRRILFEANFKRVCSMGKVRLDEDDDSAAPREFHLSPKRGGGC